MSEVARDVGDREDTEAEAERVVDAKTDGEAGGPKQGEAGDGGVSSIASASMIMSVNSCGMRMRFGNAGIAGRADGRVRGEAGISRVGVVVRSVVTSLLSLRVGMWVSRLVCCVAAVWWVAEYGGGMVVWWYVAVAVADQPR